jgi:4-hydroxy-4-methyl-2-oxoglutarate aldolase
MRLGTCVERITRADADAVAALGSAGVATVHEAQGRTGLLDQALRPIGAGTAAGTAVTALCPPGDNWMLHLAIETMRPGDMLVVAVTSPNTDGYFGDILAEFLRIRGGRGVVLDCGVRDVAALRESGLPVWARAICAQGTVKESLGAVNVPVICGGVHIVPGDVIVGDEDGVVAVPAAHAAQVAQAAKARIEKEEAIRARLRAGEATLDIFGLRDRLSARGMRRFETLADLERAEREG